MVHAPKSLLNSAFRTDRRTRFIFVVPSVRSFRGGVRERDRQTDRQREREAGNFLQMKGGEEANDALAATAAD